MINHLCTEYTSTFEIIWCGPQIKLVCVCVNCQTCTQPETFPYSNAAHQRFCFTKPCSVPTLWVHNLTDFLICSPAIDKKPTALSAIGQRKGTVIAAGLEGGRVAGVRTLENWKLRFRLPPLCSNWDMCGWRMDCVLQGPENSESRILLCGEIRLRIHDLLIGSLLHFPALCLGTALLLSRHKVTCGCAHRGRKPRHLLLLPLLDLDVALYHPQLYPLFFPFKKF